MWSIEGKAVLITGAARGMGAVTGLELAKKGAARILLVDWEGEAGTRTRDRINREAGRDVAVFQYCDLSSEAEVRELGAFVNENFDALHVLVNNAGITDAVRRLSVDGREMHVATCHLAHFLLTHLVLELMKASAPSRIINISSDAHKAGPGVDFEDLNNVALWKGRPVSNGAAFQAYHRAKIANLYFTQELAERLNGSDITVNAVSPGYFVNTTIYRNTTGILGHCARLFFSTLGFFGVNTPEKGARTHIYLATSDDVSGVTGRYFGQCREKAMSDLAQDPVPRARLWQWSEETLNLRSDG